MSSSDGPRDTQEPTTTEIVKAFPAGVKRLYSDMIRYKNECLDDSTKSAVPRKLQRAIHYRGRGAEAW